MSEQSFNHESSKSLSGRENAQTLAQKIISGKTEGISKNQMQMLTVKYIIDWSEPNTVARELAMLIGAGYHSWDLLPGVKDRLAPDLPKEKLGQLLLETLVRSAGTDATESEGIRAYRTDEEPHKSIRPKKSEK